MLVLRANSKKPTNLFIKGVDLVERVTFLEDKFANMLVVRTLEK